MYIYDIKLAADLFLKPALKINLIIVIVEFDIVLYFLYHMKIRSVLLNIFPIYISNTKMIKVLV